jgi:hypothetical protein
MKEVLDDILMILSSKVSKGPEKLCNKIKFSNLWMAKQNEFDPH